MSRAVSVALAMLAAMAIARAPLAGQIPPFGTAAEYVADLGARRATAMTGFGPESVVVLWSPPTRVYSNDVNYEYRQETNLLYLSGIDQEGTILVLIPGATSRKAVLFVRAIDPMRALWYGRVPTAAEIAAASGIATVYPQRGTEAFDAFMTGLFAGMGYRQSREEAEADFGSFFRAVKGGTARLGINDRLDDRDRNSLERPEAGAHVAWAREIAQRHPGVTPFNAGSALAAQRQIKTPYEQRVLRRSVEISAEAHLEAMRATRPGRWEYEIESVLEAWFHKSGALSPGYPSIVGSGPNATTLHYLESSRQVQAGDLLLVDAAGRYQGLTGDITRTYPVSGRFTAAQRAIYDLVLSAQNSGIAAAKPGRPVEEIVAAVRATIGTGLTELGLVRTTGAGPEREAEISLWLPHGPVHGIGMDVHETVTTLDAGVAFVIEPGLYFRPDAFDRLPPSLAAAGALAPLKNAFEKYRDIGVRIEDSFLMTATGPVMLSAKAPRVGADVERVVGKGR